MFGCGSWNQVNPLIEGWGYSSVQEGNQNGIKGTQDGIDR